MEKVKNFETLTSEQIVERLKTDRKHGLTEEEAAKRLEANGKNKLAEKAKDPWYKIFFAQFNDAMIFVLFAAIFVTAAISIYDTVKWLRAGNAFDFFGVGDWPDVIIILCVVLINAVLGTVQEIKARSSLDALKNFPAPKRPSSATENAAKSNRKIWSWAI